MHAADPAKDVLPAGQFVQTVPSGDETLPSGQ